MSPKRPISYAVLRGKVIETDLVEFGGRGGDIADKKCEIATRTAYTAVESGSAIAERRSDARGDDFYMIWRCVHSSPRVSG